MPLDKIREHLAQVLEIDKNDLVYPSFSHLGDLSLPLFKFTQEKTFIGGFSFILER